MRQGNLVRKQFLVSDKNIKKVNKIAKVKGTSAAEIVRLAIDAYNPEEVANMEADDLMELVSARLKDSIAATKKANRVVAKAIKSLN